MCLTCLGAGQVVCWWSTLTCVECAGSWRVNHRLRAGHKRLNLSRMCWQVGRWRLRSCTIVLLCVELACWQLRANLPIFDVWGARWCFNFNVQTDVFMSLQLAGSRVPGSSGVSGLRGQRTGRPSGEQAAGSPPHASQVFFRPGHKAQES